MNYQLLDGISKKNLTDIQIKLFEDRFCFIDCRGTLEIHQSAMFGFNVKIYTLSHDINDLTKCVDRPVRIEKEAFIGSESILYNCTVGEKAFVSIGSVVKNITIEPYTMVSGNPAIVIKRFHQTMNKWIKV